MANVVADEGRSLGVDGVVEASEVGMESPVVTAETGTPRISARAAGDEDASRFEWRSRCRELVHEP